MVSESAGTGPAGMDGGLYGQTKCNVTLWLAKEDTTAADAAVFRRDYCSVLKSHV